MKFRVFAITTALLLALPSFLLAGESLDQAIALYEQGDLTAAKQSFTNILDADAEDHAALFYLGRIALAEQDLDGAIEQLQKAVKLNGTDSNYRTWLGRAYIQKLQTVSFFEKGVLSGRALDNLKKAVELDPSNIEARISLGGYYLNAPSIAGGSKKKALEQAEEVVKYDALEGNWMLARIHIKNEEYDEAIAKLGACIDAKPDNIEYRYHLGMLYQELERYEEAFEVFEAVVEIEPDNRSVLYQIGRTAAFSGTNLDRGIECLDRYLTMEVTPGNPGYDGAHWRLGMIYEHSGDLAMARTEYENRGRAQPGRRAVPGVTRRTRQGLMTGRSLNIMTDQNAATRVKEMFGWQSSKGMLLVAAGITVVISAFQIHLDLVLMLREIATNFITCLSITYSIGMVMALYCPERHPRRRNVFVLLPVIAAGGVLGGLISWGINDLLFPYRITHPLIYLLIVAHAFYHLRPGHDRLREHLGQTGCNRRAAGREGSTGADAPAPEDGGGSCRPCAHV